MKKKLKYTVHAPQRDVARFSNYEHALRFAVLLSQLKPRYLIEVSEKSGLVGQYLSGRPTAEFRQHHIAAFH